MELIEVTVKYSIGRPDELNWAIVKHGTNRKTGKPTEVVVGYFPKLGQVVEHLMELLVAENNSSREVSSLESLNADIFKAEEQIQEGLDRFVERYQN